MQSVASSLPPTSTYVPTAQSMQLATLPLPAVSTYVPAAHAMQSDDDGPAAVDDVEYRPATQSPVH